MIKLSIVIPSIDDLAVVKEYLPRIASLVENPPDVEWIFVNANPDKEVEAFVMGLNDVKYVFSEVARRSTQMNLGASLALGESLFFLHLDSIPPSGFDQKIIQALHAGVPSGCFRLKFDMKHWVLNTSEWFTRFGFAFVRGGDQGLFLQKDEFTSLGGFESEWAIFEDIEFCKKLIRRGGFTVLPHSILTSARKYQRIGPLKLQMLFGLLTLGYWLGISNQRLLKFYQAKISSKPRL